MIQVLCNVQIQDNWITLNICETCISIFMGGQVEGIQAAPRQWLAHPLLHKIGITRNGHRLHKQIVTRFMASTPPTTSYFLHFWWLHNELNTSGFESQRPEFWNIENWWSYNPHNIKNLNFILTTSFRVLNLLEWFSFFSLWIFGSLYNTHVAKQVISRWAKRKAHLVKKD